MRVLILNNYDLERVSTEVRRGEKPAHHLFAIDVLARQGWQVEIIPQGAGPRGLRRLGDALTAVKFPIPLGDLAQQLTAWRRRHAADVIYAPCQTQTQALAYLRAGGLLRTPLVVVAHHPPLIGRLAWLRRWFFQREFSGTDLYPALSAGVAREICAAGCNHFPALGNPPLLRWGPDLDFYDRYVQPGPGSGVIATGRTGRDWITFGRGATRAGVPAQIFCLSSDVRKAFADFGSNVRIRAHADERDLPYSTLLPELAQARVLAVPLASSTALAGLTSVTDALGLGRPLAVTRHPLLDLDLEGEGIGRWVEPGAVEGWAKTLRWFEEHPAESVAMGRRARVLAERRWNSGAFAQQIGQLLERAIQARDLVTRAV